MCEHDKTTVVTGEAGKARQACSARTAIAMLAAMHVRRMLAEGWYVSYEDGAMILIPGLGVRR